MQKLECYKNIHEQIESILNDVWITNLSNFSAILMQNLANINWVGFYLLKDQNLFLGPFQGLPACLYIPINKGVCGYAALNRKSIMVNDVHEFPGHISCDPNSKSEIVIPLIYKDQLLGVLDIDSPILNRFDDVDKSQLELLGQVLVEKTKWPNSFNI